MNGSFYNGISGIKTNQYGIDIWSNNIAGISTAGFKASTPEFSNIFNTQLQNSYFNPISNDIGLGSSIQGSTTDFRLGSLIDTGNKYDLAINGKGWFGVTDQNGDKFYTRAGAFQKDRDGFLVDNEGNYVTGSSTNNFTNGVIVDNPKLNAEFGLISNQKKIQLPDELIIPSSPTTEVKFAGSLNADIITKFSPLTEKEEEVANIEIYRTNIIDGNGDENSLEITFTKVVPQTPIGIQWNAQAIVRDRDKNILSTQDGQIAFNERGAIISNELTTIDNNGSQISLNFGTLYDSNTPKSGFDGLVSLRGFEGERITTKDGHKQGNIIEYGFNREGVIVANFDNGQTIPMYKIAVYNFQNENGLEQANPVYFKETVNSGKARFYTDKDGNQLQTSSISNKKLEMSNVNYAAALTELLIIQKAFDASAKSITTSDQMIQNAINMKK